MADIFISYARSDQLKIEQLAAALEQAGYSVWWDRHIRAGEEFSRDIEKAIAEAKAVVVAWSKSSVKSEWVREEASFAREHGKIVPIRLDETLPPFGYRQRQAIDFSTGPMDEAKLDSLATAVERLVGGNRRSILPVVSAENRRTAAFSMVGIALVILLAIAGYWWSTRNVAPSDSTMAVKAEDARSIAVLPFHIATPKDENRYIADALAIQILNRLDALQDLQVAPRTASFATREQEQDVAEIGARLGVDHLVEGDFVHSGDRYRISARLVRTTNGRSLWSDSYDVDADDLAQVQSDIAEEIVTALDIVLDERKRGRMAAAGTDNVEAFARFLEIEEADREAHKRGAGPAPIYQVSLLYQQLFSEEPRLWQAAYKAADAYTHIMFGRSSGRRRANQPSDVAEVWDDAKERHDQLLVAARKAAKRPTDRAMIEHNRLVFADDWRDLGKNARKMFAKADTCDAPTYAQFVITFGATQEAYEYFKAKQHCMRSHVQTARDFADLGFYLGRHNEVLSILERLVKRGIVPPPLLDHYRFAHAMYEGRTDDALRISRQMGQSDQFYEAMIRGDSDVVNDMTSAPIHQIFKSGPSLLAGLARAGFKNELEQLAAQIDVHPEGPTVLHLAHVECNCGPLFSLSRTPRYAKRLRAAGAQWPPRAGVRWPLKDW